MTATLPLPKPPALLLLLAGVALYLYSRKSNAADGAVSTLRGPMQRTRPINTNPDLWVRLGETDHATAALRADIIQLPDFGRADVRNAKEARLFAAIIKQPDTGYQTPDEAWAGAQPSIDADTLRNLARWNPRIDTQEPTYSPRQFEQFRPDLLFTGPPDNSPRPFADAFRRFLNLGFTG